MSTQPKLTVLFRSEEESWSSFAKRIREAQGEVIVVLSSVDNNFLLQEEERRTFLGDLAKLRYRVRLATKEPLILRAARGESITVYDRTKTLRKALHKHPELDEALRFFSPSLWRQQWRSRLQMLGLLSLPKVRIWVLIGVSVLVFVFVLFRLLPSAEVRIWPREDVITQTMNVMLVHSGSSLPPAGHVRQMPLILLQATVEKTLTFRDISPEFTGRDSEAVMTVINKSPEQMSFRTGTRLLNQAGMIFRTKEPVVIEPGSKSDVRAVADHVDLYGNIIGERGNVPANVQWDVPGLPLAEQKFITVINQRPATGGKSASRKVLQQKDLDAAERRLRQELLVEAQKRIEDERERRNSANPEQQIELLTRESVIVATYSGIVLPTAALGTAVDSIELRGMLTYTVPAYDTKMIVASYSEELEGHAEEGKHVLDQTIWLDPQKVVIIEYDDSIDWIKITVDVAGNEQFVLDPLTPVGVKFGKRVRDAVVGLSKAEALRILRNFPEVERVEIAVWPPWSTHLPDIPSNITIEQQ